MATRSRRAVCIVGPEADETVRSVRRAVSSSGGRAVLFDTDRVSALTALSWSAEGVRFGRERLDAARCFYLKSVHLSLALPSVEDLRRPELSTAGERYVAERERHSLLTSVLRSLEDGRTFVNRLEAFELHLLKLAQLVKLERAGVAVPRTLATSDAASVRAFFERHRRVIYKPLSGGALTRRLTRRDLTPERLETLRRAPVLFQEQIVGRELRVYVLGGEPCAVFELPTEGVDDARVNLHRAKRTRLEPGGLAICVAAAKALDLAFTAVDLRLGRDGRYVVLECNPTPAIVPFDGADGPVSRALGAFLVAHA